MVRRIIDFRIAQMDIDARTDHFPEVLALRKSFQIEDDDALMLEVAAEATRNPRVMAMLEEADARMFANGCAHMKKNPSSSSTSTFVAALKCLLP